ncbi:transglutaminase-like enzyme, predicted cysteine protease [Schinkia azotoformans MEV2011]|uniref:Transglutaminase-like enzyme, predicted cysteine protease n=1 Tax=Schinkia azotoformans MEV2011 TaxID=1348973 RepID=A0A072NPJ2_SCHAZ|nr:transglutaminase domain-containing protein [Schinkia azotoformans]KEF38848.1 transglutaminase-like enzyme, predicted cysteine protease [Schinkia azotoformans MEV2011]MEC1696752.1 transglutaminase domain-containing protein [Schinkia azotoformans]MEC1725039.1 transglutaminase domain-containing protein [Schinkia azotoformans]MEC1772292.1 transglutaminase domain-containing protein [Schinkia azotoformans]MEC1781353.1 transglutaminase domain-containing protein [Schinkia azotoformans]
MDKHKTKFISVCLILIATICIVVGENSPVFSYSEINEQTKKMANKSRDESVNTHLIQTNTNYSNEEQTLNVFSKSIIDGLIEVTPPSYFVLGFDKEIYLDKIDIHLENKLKLPIQYTIDDVDFYGTKISEIVNFSSSKERLTIDLKNYNSAYIKISLNIVDSQLIQTGLKLKKIKVYGKPTSPYEEEIFLKSKGNFLSGNDIDNPLTIFRAPIQKSVYNLSNEIIGNDSNLSDHEKVIKYIDYMKSYKIGFASNALAINTIREKIGQCGSFTNTLIALAKSQGINGRVIYMMNYPENAGHTVAELWINGKWRMYDPTYGVYYTNTPNNFKNPNILSFNELKNGGGRDKNISRVITNQIRLDEGKPLSYKFINLEIYEKSNPSGPIGPNNIFIYPLKMDAVTKNVITKVDFSLKNQGAEYIGVAFINSNHSWTFSSLVKDKVYKFVITPGLLGTEKGLEDEFKISVESLSGMKIIGAKEKAFNKIQGTFEALEIKFVAKDTQAKLLISHPYIDDKFHYLMIDKYELIETER